MKVINLDNIKIFEFYLGKNRYKYQFKSEDKEYYFSSINNLHPKKDNSEKLIEIFKNILEKQNLSVKIQINDIKGLFNFFNYALL